MYGKSSSVMRVCAQIGTTCTEDQRTGASWWVVKTPPSGPHSCSVPLSSPHLLTPLPSGINARHDSPAGSWFLPTTTPSSTTMSAPPAAPTVKRDSDSGEEDGRTHITSAAIPLIVCKQEEDVLFHHLGIPSSPALTRKLSERTARQATAAVCARARCEGKHPRATHARCCRCRWSR